MQELDKDALLVRCAYLFYQDKLNIKEVGQRLNISRFKVSRYLKEAEERGYVEIRFQFPGNQYETLAMEIEDHFKVPRVIIVPVTAEMEGETIRKIVGQRGTEILKECKTNSSIGVTWGRTIATMVRELPVDAIQLSRITELTGGYGMINPKLSTSSLAPLLAHKTNASCYQMHGPILTSNEEIARSILADQSLMRTLEMGAASDMAIFGVANLSRESMLYQSHMMSEQQLGYLKSKGAVGSMIGRFFNSAGEEVQSIYTSRSIALSWQDFLKIPERIALVGGRGKVEAIEGMLTGGVATTIILDNLAAQEIRQRIMQGREHSDAEK